MAPLPVQDTPEVSEARAKHLNVLNEEFSRAAREGPLTGEPVFVETVQVPVETQQFVASPSQSAVESAENRAARELHYAAIQAALDQHRSSF